MANILTVDKILKINNKKRTVYSLIAAVDDDYIMLFGWHASPEKCIENAKKESTYFSKWSRYKDIQFIKKEIVETTDIVKFDNIKFE